jgi:hypothetical protein
MSNEKTCEACGGPGINAMPTTDHADICGAMACSDCWFKGSRFVHASVRARRQRIGANEKTVRPPCDACGAESCASPRTGIAVSVDGFRLCVDCWWAGRSATKEIIAARRQRTAEPRFVDRNGVELHLGDVIRCDGMQDIAIVALYRREAFGRIETIADAPREPGSSAPRRAINLEKFWTRIDPPADEPTPAGYTVLGIDYAAGYHCRETLIRALLADSGHTPPPDGYGDVERDRVTRMVDAQAALLARLERDLGMVAMLGEMFCRTSGDCEP